MPDSSTKPARPLRATLARCAVVGADGLALVMSMCAAAEHETAHRAASMVLGDEGELDALLYQLAAGAQPRSALSSPVPRVARPTLCLSLLFYYACSAVLRRKEVYFDSEFGSLQSKINVRTLDNFTACAALTRRLPRLFAR